MLPPKMRVFSPRWGSFESADKTWDVLVIGNLTFWCELIHSSNLGKSIIYAICFTWHTWAMKKKTCWLGYIGDYTTQVYRGYNKPIIRIPFNQPVQWKVGGFFSWLTLRTCSLLSGCWDGEISFTRSRKSSLAPSWPRPRQPCQWPHVMQLVCWRRTLPISRTVSAGAKKKHTHTEDLVVHDGASGNYL